jgi:hypothetical protein
MWLHYVPEFSPTRSISLCGLVRGGGRSHEFPLAVKCKNVIGELVCPRTSRFEPVKFDEAGKSVGCGESVQLTEDGGKFGCPVPPGDGLQGNKDFLCVSIGEMPRRHAMGNDGGNGVGSASNCCAYETAFSFG